MLFVGWDESCRGHGHAHTHALTSQRRISGYERRPVMVLRKRMHAPSSHTRSHTPHTHRVQDQRVRAAAHHGAAQAMHTHTHTHTHTHARAPAHTQRKISGYERRPIVVLRKRKQSAVLNAWYNLSEDRRRRRLRFERAAKHFVNQQYTKAWNSWCVGVCMRERERERERPTSSEPWPGSHGV